MIDPNVLKIHAAACEAQEPGYVDPVSGLFVLTSFALRERESCCGNGCRHCPYPTHDQQLAGRPRVPVYVYPLNEDEA